MIARRNSLGAACFMLLAVSACNVSTDESDDSNKVNGSIHVPAGKAATDVSTVNGSISVEDHGSVDSAKTVNGNIKLGAHATGTDLHTVNGRITLGSGAHATDAIAVNGDLTLDEGADLTGRLGNVNGKISMTGAHVGGGIKTTNGGISIMGPSRVEGGIEVEETSGNSLLNAGDPVVIIGPGVTVQGDLLFKRKVKLYVSDRATVGTVTGATPIPFSGDKPPS